MPLHTSARPKTVVVVGNPRRLSRTRVAAEAVADALISTLAATESGHPEVGGPESAATSVIDLADLLPDLATDAGDGVVAEALTSIIDADVLIVATPVYKGSLTGLLKLFLDRVPSAGLRGVTVVPVTVAAADSHRLLADLHLRPVLSELGAAVPTGSVTLTEAELPRIAEVASEWAAHAAPIIGAVVAAQRAGRPAAQSAAEVPA